MSHSVCGVIRDCVVRIRLGGWIVLILLYFPSLQSCKKKEEEKSDISSNE